MPGKIALAQPLLPDRQGVQVWQDRLAGRRPTRVNLGGSDPGRSRKRRRSR
jgi:hypothetical protein